MKKIIIIGCGGHAAEIVDYIEHINLVNEKTFDIIGLIDDNYDNYIKYKYSQDYLGKISDHKILFDVFYIIGIGDIIFRKTIVEKFLNENAKFTNIVHPKALISKKSFIGIGNVISHNVSIGPMVNLGDFNVINSRVTVGHDSIIGNFNFISPLVSFGGNSKIGNNNLIGTNACLLPKVEIGNSNKVMAGMIVDKKIESNEVIYYRYKEKIFFKN